MNIRIYQTRTGHQPYVDWFESLDNSVRAHVATRIDRAEAHHFGDSKAIKGGAGVRELRLHIGSGYRIYFANDGAEIVFLLTGGDKGSQKKDITMAIKFWKDYRSWKR